MTCTTEVVAVNGMEVPRSECIHYLGAWLDQYISLKSHITKMCTTAMLSFQQIKLIQRYLAKDAPTTLVLYLVISHLDYCNSILYSLPDCGINKFQRIKHMSAKLVLKCNKSDSAPQCLKASTSYPLEKELSSKC